MFNRVYRRAGYARVALCCVCLALSSHVALADPAKSQPAPSAPNVAAVRDGELAAAIDRAARGAQRRLEGADCQQVLDQFADDRGQTLREVTSSLALSPDAWLGRIIFRDGRDAATCQRAAAFTGTGSRVVFVCPKRFTAVSRAETELIVIHEMLHTLGLRELPPTPREIDRAVTRRCGA